MSQTVADVLVDALEQIGVKHIPGVPSELVDNFVRSPRREMPGGVDYKHVDVTRKEPAKESLDGRRSTRRVAGVA